MQQTFSKFSFFNGLLMASAVLAAYAPIGALPDRRPMAPAIVALDYRPVALPPAQGPLRLAGAWEMTAADPRLGGLSALALDQGRFIAVSDRGAVVRFEPPSAKRPTMLLQDLRQGPGPAGRKWSRDAESLVRDSAGRGWWVGFEQRHSLWLYDRSFNRARDSIDLPKLGWRDNRGAEALLLRDGGLLVLAENGRHAVALRRGPPRLLKLKAGAEVADAATAPDGSAWVLLRKGALGGIRQSIGPLREAEEGYQVGTFLPLPKAPFDNYEGMAITPLPGGRWRFWLVTDDGHRFQARTLLVALDLNSPPTRHDKSPARNAGLLSKPSVETD